MQFEKKFITRLKNILQIFLFALLLMILKMRVYGARRIWDTRYNFNTPGVRSFRFDKRRSEVKEKKKIRNKGGHLW